MTPTPVPTASATRTPDPVNDTCPNATVVASDPFIDTVSVRNATTDDADPEPACGNRSRDQSVWYRVTPPVGGILTAETTGSTYDTILSTYSGSCDALVAVPDGCNDDQPGTSQSRLVLPVVGGTTYRFMVTSYGSAAITTLVFSVAFAPGEDTPTPTPSGTVTPTATPLPTATVPSVPTATPVASATAAPSPSVTPTPSRTAPPSPSVTRTATAPPTGTATVPVTPGTETPTPAPAIPLLFVTGSNQYVCAFELAQAIGIAGGTESFARLAERSAESLRGLYQAIYVAPDLGPEDYARLRAMVATGGTIERFVALGGVAVLNVAGTLGDQAAVAPDGVGFAGANQHEAEELATPLHPYVTGVGYGGETLDSASFESVVADRLRCAERTAQRRHVGSGQLDRAELGRVCARGRPRDRDVARLLLAGATGVAAGGDAEPVALRAILSRLGTHAGADRDADRYADGNAHRASDPHADAGPVPQRDADPYPDARNPARRPRW